MGHPFEKLFEAALRRSTPMDNQVLVEAEKLKNRGYRATEIYEVLERFRKGRIDESESEIADEAAEEFERHV